MASLEEVQTKSATLWHVCEGRAARLLINWDRDRALGGLGLKE